jgi:DNA-binding NarL/FixJ family response regulator
LTLRVAIADDSLLVREGVSQLLSGAPWIEVVAVCEDTYSLLKAIEADAPDVVLTDIRMPPFREREGIRVAAELRESHPEMSPGPAGGHICSRSASVTVASWWKRSRRLRRVGRWSTPRSSMV